MKKNYLLVLFIFGIVQNYAQNSNDSINKQPLVVVEKMPEFKGGEGARSKWIFNEIVKRGYPTKERDAGIQGTVYLTFVVEKDGSITNVKVLKGVFGGPGYDKLALDIAKAMPPWDPGSQNGIPVPVQMNMPMKFSVSGVVQQPYEPTAEEKKKINEANIFYNRGVEYAKKEDYENALKEFDEVLKISPGDYEALYNKGFMYYKMNKNSEACVIWNQLKSIGSSIADAMLQKVCNDSTKINNTIH